MIFKQNATNGNRKFKAFSFFRFKEQIWSLNKIQKLHHIFKGSDECIMFKTETSNVANSNYI